MFGIIYIVSANNFFIQKEKDETTTYSISYTLWVYSKWNTRTVDGMAIWIRKMSLSTQYKHVHYHP